MVNDSAAISDTSDPSWQRSTWCASNGCVEVARLNGRILVRDSKRSDSPVLEFDATEWRAFVGGVKGSEFDL